MGDLGFIAGLKVVETDHLVIGPFEDWSGVRSHARARRRRRQGHPQRIRIYYLPDPNLMKTADTLFGHPATIRALKAKLAEMQP